MRRISERDVPVRGAKLNATTSLPLTSVESRTHANEAVWIGLCEHQVGWVVAVLIECIGLRVRTQVRNVSSTSTTSSTMGRSALR